VKAGKRQSGLGNADELDATLWQETNPKHK
jgi:hypothetical protein